MIGPPCDDVTFSAVVRDGRVDVEGPREVELGFGHVRGADQSWKGVGVRWKWDGTKLTVQNDRFGFFPVFYRGSGMAFTISNNLVSLLREGSTLSLNDQALAVFLRLGYFIGNQTAFEAIEVLPPASLLTWQPGRLLRERQSPPGPDWGTAPNRDRAITIYGELFAHAVSDLLPETDTPAALPLSGGRDSRHILLAMDAAGRLPDACITMRHYAPKPDEDAEVARRLASRVGARHVVLPPPGRRLEAELEKNLATHFLADEHAWMLPLGRYLHEHRFEVSYDGIAGDVLSAGLFLSEQGLEFFAEEDLVPLAEHLLGPEGYLSRMLTPSHYGRWNRELALEALTQELERHRSARNPVAQFYFWNRTRREIAAGSWGILGRGTRILAPYLNPNVYGFLSSLPAEYFLDHRFHDETIHRMYPGYRSIPFERKKGTLRVEDRRKVIRYVYDVSRFFRPEMQRGGLLNTRFLLPRMAFALGSRSYGTVLPQIIWPAIHLTQLRALLRPR